MTFSLKIDLCSFETNYDNFQITRKINCFHMSLYSFICFYKNKLFWVFCFLVFHALFTHGWFNSVIIMKVKKKSIMMWTKWKHDPKCIRTILFWKNLNFIIIYTVVYLMTMCDDEEFNLEKFETSICMSFQTRIFHL